MDTNKMSSQSGINLRNLWTSLLIVLVVLCSLSATAQVYHYTVSDANGSPLVRFLDDGIVEMLRGIKVENATPLQLTPNEAIPEFIIRNTTEVVARIDGISGNFYLKGGSSIAHPLQENPNAREFIIRDDLGKVVFKIDEGGNAISHDKSPCPPATPHKVTIKVSGLGTVSPYVGDQCFSTNASLTVTATEDPDLLQRFDRITVTPPYLNTQAFVFPTQSFTVTRDMTITVHFRAMNLEDDLSNWAPWAAPNLGYTRESFDNNGLYGSLPAPNGIPDAAEFALLQNILLDTNHPEHAATRTLWLAARASAFANAGVGFVYGSNCEKKLKLNGKRLSALAAYRCLGYESNVSTNVYFQIKRISSGCSFPPLSVLWPNPNPPFPLVPPPAPTLAPYGDLDADGYTNAQEWAFAYDPAIPFDVALANFLNLVNDPLNTLLRFYKSGQMAVTLRFDGPDDISALGLVVKLPAGWTYNEAATGWPAHVNPATNALEFYWVDIPDFPYNFVLKANIPAGYTTSGTLTHHALYRTDGPENVTETVYTPFAFNATADNEEEFLINLEGAGAAATFAVQAGIAGTCPLVTCPTYHSADQNQDWVISLSELLRVIQFFNLFSYHCEALGEDGFNPGIGDQSCTPHSSDYSPQDWTINLTELLRVIQLFNLFCYVEDPANASDDGYLPCVEANDVEVNFLVEKIVPQPPANCTGEPDNEDEDYDEYNTLEYIDCGTEYAPRHYFGAPLEPVNHILHGFGQAKKDNFVDYLTTLHNVVIGTEDSQNFFPSLLMQYFPLPFINTDLLYDTPADQYAFYFQKLADIFSNPGPLSDQDFQTAKDKMIPQIAVMLRSQSIRECGSLNHIVTLQTSVITGMLTLRVQPQYYLPEETALSVDLSDTANINTNISAALHSLSFINTLSGVEDLTVTGNSLSPLGTGITVEFKGHMRNRFVAVSMIIDGDDCSTCDPTTCPTCELTPCPPCVVSIVQEGEASKLSMDQPLNKAACARSDVDSKIVRDRLAADVAYGLWNTFGNSPFFLRVGHEANGLEYNQYCPDTYKDTYKAIIQACRNFVGPDSKKLNFAAIWHIYPTQQAWESYYPDGQDSSGRDFVDWIGVSIFGYAEVNSFIWSKPDDPNEPIIPSVAYKWQEEAVNYAISKNKPIMICESTPADIGSSYFANASTHEVAVEAGVEWDDPSDAGGLRAWRHWYKGYFNYIRKHPSVKAFCYINEDWRTDTYNDKWEKNAQIGTNGKVAYLYAREMSNEFYYHNDDLQLPEKTWPDKDDLIRYSSSGGVDYLYILPSGNITLPHGSIVDINSDPPTPLLANGGLNIPQIILDGSFTNFTPIFQVNAGTAAVPKIVALLGFGNYTRDTGTEILSGIEGNLYLVGDAIYNEPCLLDDPAKFEYLFKDSLCEVVAKIDSSGNLKTIGTTPTPTLIPGIVGHMPFDETLIKCGDCILKCCPPDLCDSFPASVSSPIIFSKSMDSDEVLSISEDGTVSIPKGDIYHGAQQPIFAPNAELEITNLVEVGGVLKATLTLEIIPNEVTKAHLWVAEGFMVDTLPPYDLHDCVECYFVKREDGLPMVAISKEGLMYTQGEIIVGGETSENILNPERRGWPDDSFLE